MNTFAKQPNIQRKALQKALKSPLIGKHGKRRATLLKEEVYKDMQQRILEKVDVLIEAQMNLALKGNNGKPDTRSIDSLLNRVFGKPAQEIGISGTSKGMGQLLDEIEAENGIKAMSKEALRQYIGQRATKD